MAFGSQKTIGLILVLALWPAAAETFRYEVRHHAPARRLLGKTRLGVLEIGDTGVVFRETGKSKKPLHLNVAFRDIQQLMLEPGELTIRLYDDSSVWKLGADKVFRFDRPKAGDFAAMDGFLRARLDQKYVSAVPREQPPAEVLWEVAVKHHRAVKGSQGVLRVGKDWISYTTKEEGDSRTWRFEDIENISVTPPYELILTTYERSRYHYGGFKDFRFQLKQRLEEGRYQQLWKALNRDRQSNILQQYNRKENGL